MAEQDNQQKNSQNNIQPKSVHAEREERVLAFWKEKGIFEKSLNKDAPKGDYTFYDGPPFATGTPHYGHILAGTIKDVIPRFKTMQGYRVRRRWGWDCHGLPVENIVEKELGLKAKKDIIDYGIEKFNAKARESVMRYADEWRRIVPRLGRWVDMEDDYRTMDATYTESVWWIFKQLYDKGLIYEGFKSMNLCPHCGTTLSNFEVAQGYKDITDISVYVKFKINELEANRKKNEVGDTYLLAWTTTPWTLPGNVALAVGADIDYVKVKIIDDVMNSSDLLILAKARLAIFKDKKYEVVETFKGSTLVGLSYQPIFDYYSKNSKKLGTVSITSIGQNKVFVSGFENGWKIYAADFVTTEDGTGIVHIAPAFGADDYDLSLKYNLPFVQHVGTDGKFKDNFTSNADGVSFAGMSVKPKDTEEDKNAHQKADIEVIKWLAHNGSLFEKEKLIHSYPHCWRCDTPLLNYAASSWFVKVTEIKDKLVAENKKITWVPPEVGSARFGNWLEGARDWAISRSRFWGAPIPVWREENSSTKEQSKDSGQQESNVGAEKFHVIGSVEDLKKYSKAKNTYWVMRHGEAESNTNGIVSSDQNAQYKLTEKGIKDAHMTADSLKDAKIDFIVTSPILRTKETTEIVRNTLGLKESDVIVDDRIREMGFGSWEKKDIADFLKVFPLKDRFIPNSEGIESFVNVKKRMGDFLYELERKYAGKKILIVTHGSPAMMLISAAQGCDKEQSLKYEELGYIEKAEARKLDFTPLPHNAEYELDLHRPFIDDVELKTLDGNKLVRVPDVFDCWFESGSMPYGEAHYPFETCSEFEPKSGWFKKSKGYPADFIAEGLDQTRGWFYSMLVLGVALFGKTPYKKVIVNGLVLAEDGQKMSKSKQNYPDPMLIVDKYGADSLRYYMLSSPVVHGQDLRFSEKGVDEVTKKLVNRLLNVVSFYEMYGSTNQVEMSTKHEESQNILDQWVISRLNETINLVTTGLEIGELDRSVRPLMDLTDDLSTWYLRRSRDRFKGDDEVDKQAALDTTRFVLLEMAKLLAPFMPFLAEDIYRRVKVENKDQETGSVHLEMWPIAEKVDTDLLTSMKVVRELASKGLEARMITKINVRQPLKTLRVKSAEQLSAQLIELIKDEVNVKEVTFGTPIETDVQLDVVITPDLKEEGMVRELIRAIQDLRKEKGLSVNDVVALAVETDGVGRKFIEDNEKQLKATCTISDIKFGNVMGEAITIGDVSFKVSL